MNPKNTFKSLKRDTVFLSLILTVLGLLFLLLPESSGAILCYITGGALCLWGLLRVITYFTADKYEAFSSFGMVQGAALLIVGISILVSPTWLLGLIGYVFGLVLIVDGVFKLQHTFDMLRMGTRGWWIVLLVSLAVIAVGLVVFFNPFATTRVLMSFAGVCLIADGVADLITILYISGSIHSLEAGVIVEDTEDSAES